MKFTWFLLYRPQEIGNDFVNCGIYIENPNNLEMEPWKCVIVHGDNDTETGSVINIKQSISASTYRKI